MIFFIFVCLCNKSFVGKKLKIKKLDMAHLILFCFLFITLKFVKFKLDAKNKNKIIEKAK